MFCFFFKQKTAYEMRISDWSSGVCSSDLVPPEDVCFTVAVKITRTDHVPGEIVHRRRRLNVRRTAGPPDHIRPTRTIAPQDVRQPVAIEVASRSATAGNLGVPRAEEHTSELKSLMPISYAVFFVKKKN